MARTLYGLEMEVLLEVECRVLGMTVKKLLIYHLQMRNRMFSARHIGKGDVVGYIYGSFVYKSINFHQHTTKTNAVKLMHTRDVF